MQIQGRNHLGACAAVTIITVMMKIQNFVR